MDNTHMVYERKHVCALTRAATEKHGLREVRPENIMAHSSMRLKWRLLCLDLKV